MKQGAFSKVGASSLAGGMLGGFAAQALGAFWQPQSLILAGALLIFAGVGLVVKIHAIFSTNLTGNKAIANKKADFLTPFANRYALTLMLIAMSGALAGLLIDVQFYISATRANMGAKGNANFFANFYIMLNFGSLLLQLFATPRIQDNFGIRGGLMVLPFALIGGAGFATAAAAFSLSVLRVTEGGLRSSVHRSIWEQAFIPINSGDRSVVKIAADGIAARIAEGLAAAGLYLWVQNVAPGGVVSGPLDTRSMIWLILVTAVAWLMITQRLESQTRMETTPSQTVTALAVEIDCVRFSDQCPCTTELGKGIA